MLYNYTLKLVTDYRGLLFVTYLTLLKSDEIIFSKKIFWIAFKVLIYFTLIKFIIRDLIYIDTPCLPLNSPF